MARRKSIFRESGLMDEDDANSTDIGRKGRPQSVRFRSQDEVHFVERYDVDEITKLYDNEFTRTQPTKHSISSIARPTNPIMYRVGAALLLLIGLLPLFHSTNYFGHEATVPIQGVNAGVVPEGAKRDANLQRRDDSATNWCFKWAMQSALVNGTLYLYGGQLATEYNQLETLQNTWNNDFISLDLTKTWQIGGPPLTGLPQPDGPPAVALGYLWNSMDSLWLYGGEFSWKPPEDPAPLSTWEYSIADSSWVEHSDPQTSSGKGAPDDGQPVQRAAEGAGVNVPTIGRGFYFGGHLDGYTTPGWEQWIPRVYIQSLLEFTFPGYSNSEVNSLQNGQTAGSEGVYRNITDGGQQDEVGFTKRADGLLIYVPGFGDEGILVAIAGGTNETYTQMNQVNVFDIATSSWYTQATSGEYPELRVNPCAVIAAAADGSSYNIYMFGGQHLLPYGSQAQYSDLWILSLPSFTWIKVDQGGTPPYGRSGMTCDIWDAQMVMVGGYTGDQSLTCEYPGIYVLNLNTVEWQQEFTSLSSDSEEDNPLNQQSNQKSSDTDNPGLEGSFGYQVPEVIIKVIGGDKYGGATLTTPVVTPTAGPLATGSPVTYTVTKPNGEVVTATPGPNGLVSTGGDSGPNIAAIVVGVVCGVLFLVICYLLFCLFLYRKQLKLYKRHVEMSQAQARGEKGPEIPGLWTTESNNTSGQPGESAKFLSPNETSSGPGSNNPSQGGSGPQTSSTTPAGQSARRSSQGSSTEDLLSGQEPTFVGVMLNPRRSLRVINRD